ncbi:hypothetical protein CALVIDRAFT_537360 [Calocera viscosa TUFC12733]|uniref:Uncharacterized protein n=1 Tax=Calocera viscosa (strain TUFC12733) TaxID=1330018 RepID=A0A167LYI0_CALVF|nr:hypothetical protein CALVIDRAFT_537360 [Calocera viscosa TUFC12733]
MLALILAFSGPRSTTTVMQMAKCKSLKQDTWRYVFETLLDEAQTASVVLSLMRVCKEWKASS